MYRGNTTNKNYDLYITGAILVAIVTIILCVVLFACEDSGRKVADEGSGVQSQIDSNDSQDVSSDPEYTVAITGADGMWHRTQVMQKCAATLSVSKQDETGFDFAFEAAGEGGNAKFSGSALFVSENTAECAFGLAKIIFAFQENSIVVSHDGDESGLGCPENVTYDGTYGKEIPQYTDKLADDSYSADIRKSTMCISALKGCMTGSDYAKMNYIFEKGQVYVYQNAEYAYDKNGVEINVDAELKAVKYYANISGSGEHVILICSNGGKVYVAIIADGELRYYTNDSTYFSTAPRSFAAVAENYSVEIKYMSK